MCITRTLKIAILGVTILFAAIGVGDGLVGVLTMAQVKQDIKMPEVIVLGKDAKLGSVTFNHVNHNGGKYSITELVRSHAQSVIIRPNRQANSLSTHP